MLDFKGWLKTTDYRARRGIKGLLVKDIIDDDKFPSACEKYVLFCYLSMLDKEQEKAFDELYAEYISFISRKYSDEPVSGDY